VFVTHFAPCTHTINRKNFLFWGLSALNHI
jgi:hypothetical protein